MYAKQVPHHGAVVKGKQAKLVRHLAQADEIAISGELGQGGRVGAKASLVPETLLEGDSHLNNSGQKILVPRITKCPVTLCRLDFFFPRRPSICSRRI